MRPRKISNDKIHKSRHGNTKEKEKEKEKKLV
jgi:hypothetical protein